MPGQRRPAAGARRALPVPAAAAAAAAGAAHLRHVAGDSSRRRRLLPRSAAGRLRRPRAQAPLPDLAARRIAAAAQPEAARTAAAASSTSGRSSPIPTARTWCPTTRPRWSATWRSRSAFRCTAPIRGRSISAPRAAAARSSARKACRIRSASRISTPPTIWSTRSSTMRRQKPTIKKVVAKLNEGVSGLGQRQHRSLGRARARRSGGTRRRARQRVEAMAFESPKMTWERYSKKLTETGGIVEELISGRDFRSPERAAARHAARRGRGALDARPDARRPERSGVSRLQVSGEPRVRSRDHARGAEGRTPAEEGRRHRPLRARLRRGAERQERVGGLRHRDQPAQRAARRIRS